MRNIEAYHNREVYLPDGPYTLFIEPTNHCNLACVFCPQKDQTRKKGFMSLEVYEKLIEDAARSGVKKINLFFLGESLMHKGLEQMLKLGKQHGLQIRLNTNASFLFEDKARMLFESGLEYLTISFEGISKEIYESVRVKGNYETTLKNIQSAIAIKKAMQSQTRISIEIIDMEETRDAFPEFKARMEALNPDEVAVKVWRNWTGYLNSLKDVNLEDHYSVCSYPWRSMAVLWDGTFVPCCVDYDGKYPLGNSEQGVMAAWNSQAMLDLRTYLVKRKENLKKNHGFKSCHGLCAVCDIPFQPEDHPRPKV